VSEAYVRTVPQDAGAQFPDDDRDAPLGFAVAVVGLVALAASVSLARWIAWWPHSDNRQNVAALAGMVSALVALSGLVFAAVCINPRQRLALVALVFLAAVTGWWLGFEWLAASTRQDCGSGCQGRA
jgi:FtsH-binding integral membrane protein